MANQVPFIVTELGVDTDPFILHLFAALAEKERNLISQRTKAVLQVLKAQGALLGNRTNLDEARKKGHATNAAKAREFALKMQPTIKQLQAQNLSLAAIAEHLNATGVKTMLGGTWHKSTLSKLLKIF